MEMTTPVIKKAFDLFFNDNNLRKRKFPLCGPEIQRIIAFIALKDAENQNVKPLQYWALKAAVEERRSADITANVLFSLIFKEPLNISNFYELPSPSRLYQRIMKVFTDIITGNHIRHQAYLKIRQDPEIMFAVFEQNLQDQYQYQDGYLDVIVGKTEMIITYSNTMFRIFPNYDSPDNIVAIIPNRENQEFDTFWAVKFYKMFMRIRCPNIRLSIKRDDELDLDYMRNFVTNLIANEIYKRPEEGWEEAITQGKRTIYEQNGTRYDRPLTYFAIDYTLITENNYHFFIQYLFAE